MLDILATKQAYYRNKSVKYLTTYSVPGATVFFFFFLEEGKSKFVNPYFTFVLTFILKRTQGKQLGLLLFEDTNMHDK